MYPLYQSSRHGYNGVEDEATLLVFWDIQLCWQKIQCMANMGGGRGIRSFWLVQATNQSFGVCGVCNTLELTSRLAFVVCAIHLKHIRSAIGVSLTVELCEVDDEDSATFFLIRYAAPHRSATHRGPEHKPLCPGPLKNTHCLWTWASRPETHERGCFRTRPWSRHRRHFGSTPDEQEKRMESNRRAWYDLIQVTNIKNYANVQQDPDPLLDGEVFLQSRVWSS